MMRVGLGRKRQGSEGVLEPVPPKRGRIESIPLVRNSTLVSCRHGSNRKWCCIDICRLFILRASTLVQVSSEDLPTHVARVVNLPSHATSCDFHPFLHSLLLGKLLLQICLHTYRMTTHSRTRICGSQLGRSLDRLCCGRFRIVTACWSFAATARSCDRHRSIESYGLRKAIGLVRHAQQMSPCPEGVIRRPISSLVASTV